MSLLLERTVTTLGCEWKLCSKSSFGRHTGVELRLCWRWVMSGVLDVTRQRSEQRWWGWWAHRVRGLAEAERGQRGESEEEGNFIKSLPTFTQQHTVKHLLFDIYYMNEIFFPPTYDHLCRCWGHWQHCGSERGKTRLASSVGPLYCSPMDSVQGYGLQVPKNRLISRFLFYCSFKNMSYMDIHSWTGALL